jgi:hypothetical protein
VESKQRKRKSKKSEILSGTPYKSCVESREKEKAIRMKGKAERQQKRLEAAQKGGKSESLKSKTGEKGKPSLSMPSTSISSLTACAGCGETFEDDWIQCGGCLEWRHEDCSGWEGGASFLCDRC